MKTLIALSLGMSLATAALAPASALAHPIVVIVGCPSVFQKQVTIGQKVASYTSDTCVVGAPLEQQNPQSDRPSDRYWTGSYVRAAIVRDQLRWDYINSCNGRYTYSEYGESRDTHPGWNEFELINPALARDHASYEELPMTPEQAAEAMLQAKHRCESATAP